MPNIAATSTSPADMRERREPAIVITHGFSGCGKTTLSQSLLETVGALRIRSDVERKRLHGRVRASAVAPISIAGCTRR